MSGAATGSETRYPAWRLWVGPVVWAVHFLAIYALLAVLLEALPVIWVPVCG